MKITLVCLAVIIAVAAGEFCQSTDTTTCVHEICTAGQVPTCDSNVCTCAPAPTGSIRDCSTANDCEVNGYWNAHHCERKKRHCIDGRCSCHEFD